MQARIDHVAVIARDFEWTVNFFKEVFGMEIEKTGGNAPKRKVWFREGIQVNESDQNILCGGVLDHIGIKVDSREEICLKSEKYGCRRLPGKDNWVQMPQGIVIELK